LFANSDVVNSRRRQLDPQPATAGADEDRPVRERAVVEQRRQQAPLAERRDPAGDRYGPAGETLAVAVAVGARRLRRR
jgi:hypothetical protein